MAISAAVLLLPSLFLALVCVSAGGNEEIAALMELKASLDPYGELLSSWTEEGDPCSGEFEGIACNLLGGVASISLQGKGLRGRISPSVGRLRSLSGVFLHYNALNGEIPLEIANLAELSDLYLNVNNLSGGIPPAIGNMAKLQVLQLGYNGLSGSIPSQIGLLKRLNVLALQSNRLGGAIPASLGDLPELSRLDLSFNQFFGCIPSKLYLLPLLQSLDLRNNSLSGRVPPGGASFSTPEYPFSGSRGFFLTDFYLCVEGLKRIGAGFHYGNNKGLCGAGFSSLELCNSVDLLHPGKPEPYGDLPPAEIPQSATVKPHGSNSSSSSSSFSSFPVVVVGIVAGAMGIVSVLLAFVCYRRRKQKIGSSMEIADSRRSTDLIKEVSRRISSAPANSRYPGGWDSSTGGGFSPEITGSLKFNLEEIESATQHFSEVNLLAKNSFASTYKGILRDGSMVAVKSINRTSCKAEEVEFFKGLKLLSSLWHENLVGLKGFCCSSGRGECFLVYDFIANGSLSQYLETKGKEENPRVLSWPQRVAIIKGIARGIEYLHSDSEKKPSLVHQCISAENILIDHHFRPLISSAGVHKLFAEDVVFSSSKASAAMGYLAPEYANTGRFSEKSDVYAFGVILLQILTGRSKVNPFRPGADPGNLEDLVDRRLEGSYPKQEAAKLVAIALICTSEMPNMRPTMASVVQDLCRNDS